MRPGSRDLSGRRARKRPDGFSLVEVLIVITIVGVMAALLIPAFRNVTPASQASTAESNLDLLNQSVLRFNQANWELVNTNATAGTTEVVMARSLQYRGPAATASPGSPFLDPTIPIGVTDDSNTYRAVWNGRMFQMVGVGTAGLGLDLLKMNATGTAEDFPSGYKPYGSP